MMQMTLIILMIFVFITFGDASNDQLIFSALFTVLTMAGTFWFVLNLLNMLPKMRASLKVPEIKDNGIGKAGYFYLLIVAIINCSFLSQSSPLYPLNYWDDVNSYVTVSRALASGDPKAAARSVKGTAALRLLGVALACALLVAVAKTNVYATLIPLLFPRIGIAFRPLIDKKRGADSSGAEGSDLID